MGREAGDIARNRQGRLNAASRSGYRSYIVSGPLMQNLLTQVPPHARYCRPSGQTARRSLSDVRLYLGTSHCQRRPYERVNARSWPEVGRSRMSANDRGCVKTRKSDRLSDSFPTDARVSSPCASTCEYENRRFDALSPLTKSALAFSHSLDPNRPESGRLGVVQRQEHRLAEFRRL